MRTIEQNIAELEAEIRSKQGSLQRLKAEKVARDEMPADKKLAVILHDELCTGNHTDGCGWYYEVRQGAHNWASGSTHAAYLGKARRLLDLCAKHNTTPEIFMQLLRGVRE